MDFKGKFHVQSERLKGGLEVLVHECAQNGGFWEPWTREELWNRVTNLSWCVVVSGEKEETSQPASSTTDTSSPHKNGSSPLVHPPKLGGFISSGGTGSLFWTHTKNVCELKVILYVEFYLDLHMSWAGISGYMSGCFWLAQKHMWTESNTLCWVLHRHVW